MIEPGGLPWGAVVPLPSRPRSLIANQPGSGRGMALPSGLNWEPGKGLGGSVALAKRERRDWFQKLWFSGIPTPPQVHDSS